MQGRPLPSETYRDVRGKRKKLPDSDSKRSLHARKTAAKSTNEQTTKLSFIYQNEKRKEFLSNPALKGRFRNTEPQKPHSILS